MISVRIAVVQVGRLDDSTLVTDRYLDVASGLDTDAHLDITRAVSQSVVQQDFDALRQCAWSHISLDRVRCDQQEPAPGALELGADSVGVTTDEGGDVNAGARRDAPGTRQFEQLVDAIVEAGNLGQSLRRFSARDRVPAAVVADGGCCAIQPLPISGSSRI